MAGRVAPYVDNTGLVFVYDQSNTVRSYLGEPTANVVNTNGQGYDPLDLYTWAPSGYLSTWSRDPLAERSPVGGIPLKEVSSGTDAYSDTYNNLTDSLGAASSGQTWTVSIYAKAAAGTNLQLWLFEANSSGGYVALSADNYTATGNWQRIALTRTLTDGTTAAVQARIATSTNGGIIWWDGLQMEQKTKATQFTTGTRSATQGLKDLTGRSTINLSNVSFDSNAQMLFDGTNDSLVVGNNSILKNNNTSIEFIIKYLNTPNGDIIQFGVGSGTYAQYYYRAYSGYSFWNWYPVGTGYGEIAIPNAALPLNKFHHVVMTGTPEGYVQFYINGIAQSGATRTPNSQPANWTPADLTIGGFSWDGYSNSEIPYVKIYNKVLTASEIQQNFNAVRGRYGI